MHIYAFICKISLQMRAWTHIYATMCIIRAIKLNSNKMENLFQL